MSTKKNYSAELEGHEGPYFPNGIKALNKANRFENAPNTKADLEKIGRKILGFIKQDDTPQTQDNYSWFAGQEYSTRDNSGTMVVLFPWAQDWDKKSGTQTDRSIAFYTRGEVTPEELSGLAAVLTRTLVKGDLQ